MASASAWLPGRPSSRLLTDLAGDRPLTMPEGFILDSALAARHGLLGLIAHCGDERLAAAARLPYFRLKARQQVMSAHLRRLLEKLDQASIPAAVLKGPALAIKYRVAEHRTFTDLDLLVPPAHLDSCLDLLGMDQAVEAVPPQRAQADKRDIVLVDPSGLRFSLDLHWDLFSYHQLGGRAEAATETSWAAARRVEDEIGPRWVMPAETEVTFLCAHALLDHRFRLILFRDLVDLAFSPMAWPSVIEFAGRFGLAGTTYLALLIAARSLDA
ncbi:MAG: nucleotidyltransferase family protein, partial [Acidimicrobiia bacterium]